MQVVYATYSSHMADLLQDDRVDVRVMAASVLLRHRYDEAREALEHAARGEGIVAFGAREALKRGEWELDPG